MSTQEWKTPNEIIKLQRLNRKKSQLQARLVKNNNKALFASENEKKDILLESVVTQKRKNPFGKSVSGSENEPTKRHKSVHPTDITEDDSLFNLISEDRSFVKETPPSSKESAVPLLLSKKDSISFSQESVRRLFESRSQGLFVEEDEDEDAENLIQKQIYTKHLPVDWSIKSRVRFFAEVPLPNTNLKSNQEASGITSFVRCLDLDNSNSGLDISPAAKLNQCTYYWQHPHLPWMTLFPRNAKTNLSLNVASSNDAIKDSLAKDWNKSFKGLFQLLRARQCPYFYLFGNSFSVLFRAAGIGGKVEMNAMLTPTSRGLRNSLKHEGIDFSMPLKEASLNRSSEKEKDCSLNGSGSVDDDIDNFEDDEEEDEEWLESLGVDKKHIIKNIAATNARNEQRKEMTEDFSDLSLVLIEGSECQAFYNFLLNSKSLITNVGRLAGIPPTLLAPVAFPKASMQMLDIKSSKLRMDGVDYCSIELKGIVLPHVLPFVMNLFGNILDPAKTFSATLATSYCSLAFGKASQRINEDEETIPKERSTVINGDEKTVTESDIIFFAENLSDCGISKEIIKSFCRIGKYSCHLLERVCFSKEYGYSWK